MSAAVTPGVRGAEGEARAQARPQEDPRGPLEAVGRTGG